MQKIVKITSSDDDPGDALAQYANAGWRVVEISRVKEADASFEWHVLLQNDSSDADLKELDEILQEAQKKDPIKNTIMTVVVSALSLALIIIIAFALKKFL